MAEDFNIQELSDKIVKGWILCNKACVCNTPLIKNKEHQVYCVSCKKYYNENNDIIIPSDNPKMETKNDVVNSYILPSNSPDNHLTNKDDEIEKKMEDSNKYSSMIGQLLLKGWTMMDIDCPNQKCHCPLMRDVNMTMLCVCCNQHYIKESDMAQSKSIFTTGPSSESQIFSLDSSPDNINLQTSMTKPSSTITNSIIEPINTTPSTNRPTSNNGLDSSGLIDNQPKINPNKKSRTIGEVVSDQNTFLDKLPHSSFLSKTQTVHQTIDILLEKIQDASNLLKDSQNMNYNTDLIQYLNLLGQSLKIFENL